MKYEYLTTIPIEKVQQCMLESFADYQLDMSYMSVEVMRHRNAICRNQPECSVGAFDGEKMIGFLNVGIDHFNNELVAFDGGTGVIKKYRGLGVAGSMFSKAKVAAKKNGAQKFKLEVLQPNKSAIRAYEKEGFSISRKLKCYQIAFKDYSFSKKESMDIEIRSIPVNELRNYWQFLSFPVSWEHELTGMKAVEDEILVLAAYKNNNCLGFIAYSRIMCWITAIGINPDGDEKKMLTELLINNLFSHIDPPRPNVSVNNLMEEDPLNAILVNLGFNNPVDQYEMIVDL